MSVNDDADLIGIENASKVAKQVRETLRAACLPGVTTRMLDDLCRKELRALGAASAPMLFYEAPSYSFYSKNECVVHGLPDDAELAAGDVVKIDVTPFYEGFVSDTACTVIVGGSGTNETARRMVDNVEESFRKALGKCRPNARVNEIGRAVQGNTESKGYFVIRELSGHGVGRAVHEDPSILNYYDGRERGILTDGLVIAIEPMICNRKTEVRTRRDGWSIAAKTGSLTAHYEHTVMITSAGPVVLTA